MLKNKRIKAFTLIEIILYIAILGILITVVTNFSLESLEEKNIQNSKQTVKQDVDFVFDRISYEIENAKKINRFESIFGTGTPYGKIVLNKKDGTVATISLSGSSVYYQEDLNAPEIISTPGTEIETLNFLADTDGGNVPREVQIKMHVKTTDTSLPKTYEDDIQMSVVPKSSDLDGDGCLDIVDQFPVDANCCTDTDGDTLCDALDNCPLVPNTDQEDDDADGIGDSCDDAVDTGGGGGDPEIVGGTWSGNGTVDSCIYTCNYTSSFWQSICTNFQCFYTGDIDDFETDIDNDEYAGIGQVFSLDAENMYWKKTFTLDSLTVPSIPKVDRITIDLNYCHSGTRLQTWWLNGRCSGKGYHINGYFVGDQEIQLFNYLTSSWDTIDTLETHLSNNDEIDAEIVFSDEPSRYINNNKEVIVRVKFIANGAPWGDAQRWYFLAPSRYILIDALNLEVHVQDVSNCGDKVVEMDEQCDDGEHCSDGTDCTGTGASLCVGIGDEECKPRDGIGADCNKDCLNENAVCGNGLVEVGEQCDDNNTSPGDGCNADCEVETCGNGTIEGSEECDNGKVCANGSGCTVDLECSGVGDEECKMRDGDADNCSKYCLNEICGNNRVDYGEQCDDGNAVDGDGCNSICQFEWCGNQIEDIGEQCDDGTTCSDYSECTTDSECVGSGAVCIQRDYDNCNNSCEDQECGDGSTNRSIEECDDGKQCGDVAKTACVTDSDCIGIGDNQCLPRDLDGCDSNCLIEYSVCGNGAPAEFDEGCDDGNTNDGDGCSHTCMPEYVVSYNYLNPAINGEGLEREAWVVGTSSRPPEALSALINVSSFGATKPYQIEFKTLDGLESKTVGTNYSFIEDDDTNHYVGSFSESDYVDHKFDFIVDEAEFRSDETTPKRIESIKITWNGMAKTAGFSSRYVYLYIWDGSQWEELSNKKWYFWESSDKTINTTITENIDDYIDSNRRIHILVGDSKKGSNQVSTDLMEVNIKAYNYRAGYE